jgi:hypothetical protein
VEHQRTCSETTLAKLFRLGGHRFCFTGYCWSPAGQYNEGMSTLAEVESVVAQFSAEQLAELEQFVRRTRLEKIQGRGQSALDLAPLDLGEMLQPIGIRSEWYDEMLERRG